MKTSYSATNSTIAEPLDPLKHGVPANSKLAELLKILKKKCGKDSNSILHKDLDHNAYPKMEDGNNFGVAVQEEVNNTLDEVGPRTYNVLEGCQSTTSSVQST